MAENDNGRLNFSVGIDLDELKRGSDEARGLFDGIASEAQAKGADIDRAFGTDAARGFSTLAEAVSATVSQISGMEFGSAEERIGALGQVIQITEEAMKDAAASLEALRGSSDATAEEVAEAQSAYDSLSASLAAAQGEMMSLARQYDETAETARQYNATAEEQESIMVKLLGGTENYNEIMSALPGPIRGAIGAVNGLTGAAKAFIATPLGTVIAALVLAIQSLTAWFKRSQEGQEAFAKISGYVSGVLNQLMEIVLKVGKAIYGAFTDPKKAMEDFVQALKENVMNRLSAVGEMAGAVGKIFKSIFSGKWDDAKAGLGDLGNAFLKFETGVEDVGGKIKAWGEGVNDAAKESAAIASESRALELEVSRWQVRKQELDRMKAEASAKMYDTSASAEDRKKALDDYKAALQEQQDMEQKFADKRVELQERRMAITTNSDEDYMELDRLKAQSAAVETQAQQELASLTRRANSINRALGQETTDIVKEGEAREKALVSLGQMEAKLIDANNRSELSLMEDGHAKRMAELMAEREEQMAELERMTREFVALNLAAGVDVDDSGLTGAQSEELGRMLKNIEDTYSKGVLDTLDGLLDGIETYEQKRLKLEQEFSDRLASLYDEEGKLRQGVTEGNVEMLYETFIDNLNSLSREGLEEVVADLTDTLIKAEDALFMAESTGESEEKLTKLRKELEKVTKQLETAERKLNESQDKNDTGNKKNGDSTKQLGDAISRMGHEVSEVGDAFGDLGDQIGGALGDALGDIGRVTDKIGSVIGSIGEFVEVGIGGIQSMEWSGISAIEAVENASGLLAMVGTVVKMVTAIASLFNNDDKKQDEIDALQERIDQLQWELDNAEAVRIRNATGSAYSITSELYQQALADAKAANREGQSYVSMLAEWTKAANKAKASDVAHEKTVEGLIKTYTNLGYSVDKAIGEDKYKAVGDTVKNYAEQMALVQEQYEKEESKKKTDKDALQDYSNQMEELAQSIVDTMNSAMEDIIGGSYEDIAKQLGDAFVDAFEAGEDAAEAWGDTVEDIVNDIVRQMLIQQWIEPKIVEIFDKYQEKWFTNGEYNGNDAVVASMEDFSAELNGAMDEFSVAWAEVSEAMGWAADSTREAANKGIASASQESIDELNGRMTAIQGHTFSINDNVAILVTTNGQILQSVLNIEANTDRLVSALEEAEDTAEGIRELMDDITLKGVKVK